MLALGDKCDQGLLESESKPAAGSDVVFHEHD